MKGHDESGPSDWMRYATAYHAPVLCRDVVEGLITDPAGLYIDATLGGGGHSAALLDQLGEAGRVIGIDQDRQALQAAATRLRDQYGDRFRAVAGNFGYLDQVLEEIGVRRVDGILFDLGVSSHQIDTPDRGFSYMSKGPLDMRMNQEAGSSAMDIVNTWSVEQLTELFRIYGEERRAPKIARRLVDVRALDTTAALADAVSRCVPSRDVVKTLARVFQAIRIAVNDELSMLERALFAGLKILRPGGRMAVISYHSLEDRRVKRFLRYGNLDGEPVRDFYGNLITPWKLITRKLIEAGREEIAANPRARSARLRIAEKIDSSDTSI